MVQQKSHATAQVDTTNRDIAQPDPVAPTTAATRTLISRLQLKPAKKLLPKGPPATQLHTSPQPRPRFRLPQLLSLSPTKKRDGRTPEWLKPLPAAELAKLAQEVKAPAAPESVKEREEPPRTYEVPLRAEESAVRARKVTERKEKPSSAERGALSLKSFSLGKKIGSGTFGQVYIARQKASPHYIIAIKAVKKQQLVRQDGGRQLRREIEIQTHLRHPNILRLYGYFHDETHVFLMLEYAAEGELYRKLELCGRFEEPIAAKYVAQVAEGLIYLHSKHVIHRDLKLENILLDSSGVVKIADLGLSIHSVKERRTTTCGTLFAQAPEVIQAGRASGVSYGRTADIWSLGVMTFELLVGEPPFTSKLSARLESRDIRNKIIRGAVVFPSHISLSARHLISRLLRQQPTERLPLKKVLVHPWIVDHVGAAEGPLDQEGA